MLEIKNLESFNKTINSHGLIVVEFYATWCGACKMLAPILDKVASNFKDKVSFGKVNIDELRGLADETQVHATPTIVYFKHGKPIERTVGYLDEDSLTAKIKSLM